MSTATWDHGKFFKRPSLFPKSSLKKRVVHIKEEVKNDRISMIAAAMATYALFSLLPAFTSIVLIYAWFSDPQEITEQINSAGATIPEALKGYLNSTLTGLASNAKSGLGLSALVTLSVSLWSASKISKALIDAINIIYGDKEERGAIHYSALALSFTILGVILFIVALAVLVAVPVALSYIKLGGILAVIATPLSFLILLFLFSFFLSVAYRFAPSRKHSKWKILTWGAVMASVLWAITSGLFSWYAKEFGSFNKTYGSLGAAVVLMLWFYLSSYVILLGAEVNAELERGPLNKKRALEKFKT